MYGDYGIAIPERLAGEPADHVSFELDFMRFLCRKEAEALKNGDDPSKFQDAQRDFLGQHLLRWVPQMCAQVKSHCSEEFYLGLLELTQSWLRLDLETLPVKGLPRQSSWEVTGGPDRLADFGWRAREGGT